MTPQQWISEFLHEVETQDNRSTAPVVLFLVQDLRTEWLPTGGFFDNDGLMYSQDYEVPTVETIKIEEAIEHMKKVYDIDAIDDDFIPVTRREHWETRNVCLTEKGAKHHLELNGHNYKKPRIYAMHAFRNPELDDLFSSLLAIRDGE